MPTQMLPRCSSMYWLYGSYIDAFQNMVPSNSFLDVRRILASNTCPAAPNLAPTTIVPEGCPMVIPLSSAWVSERLSCTTVPPFLAATARQSATVIGTALWG